MPGDGHVRCGRRPAETEWPQGRHRVAGPPHVTLIHDTARGYPRAVNNLALSSLLAAYSEDKGIVDESSARAAVAEVITE